MSRRIKATLVFALVFAASALSGFSAQGDEAISAKQPAEAWSTLATDKWPQLVLTNNASFDGHTELEGASAFLVRMPNDEVLVGTAKHLIKKAGGVDPPIALTELDHVFTRWQVFPRTKPELSIDAKGLAETINGEANHDWLLLHLASHHSTFPSTPLTPRLRPAEIGETIYLIGVPYSDHNSAQNVYKGTVVSRPYKTFFKYEFTPPVHISGFSGAPIIDANGLLLGHGVSRFELKQKDGLEVEFGGEDASVALALWKHRNDPPATQPAAAVHLDLPAGWVPKVPKTAKPLKYAEYPDLIAFIELVAEPRADFADDVDLMAWAKLVKQNVAKNSKLENREETELKEGKIGGRPVVEYEATAESKGVKLRFRSIMIELNGCYCKLACWTTPSHWDAAQPKFEEVFANLK